MNSNAKVNESVRCITETAVGILLGRFDSLDPVDNVLRARYGEEVLSLIKEDADRYLEIYLDVFNEILSKLSKHLLTFTSKELADIHFATTNDVFLLLLSLMGLLSDRELETLCVSKA